MSRIPAQHTSAVPRSALAVAREAGLAHHSLVDKQPAEPQALRGGESSGPNGNGKGLVNGGTDGTTDGTSSAGDDDDDESDEADEEDSEKTDVTCPPRATPSMSDSQSSAAGPLKRTFDEAGLGKQFMIDGLEFDISSAQDDDDVVFPRKKIKKRISATDQGILAYNEEKTEDEGDEEDGGLTCDDDDDGNITDFEEEALVREFENDEELLREIGIIDTPIAAPAAQIDLFDPALLQDLDNEIFDAMCNNPHRFDDLQDLQDLQSPFDWNPFIAESEGDLFPAHPTPGASPDATPRASISEQGRIIQSSASSPSGENESDESSEDEVANLSPFFEMNNATLKHLVSTEGKGAWGEGTDDDDADLVKYFFSSSSSVESDSGEATDDEETDDDEEEQSTAHLAG
ncbi:hypothetical protein FN846DRAFT_962080 [Sphaerosporella brunnea]|uniref:Uncharacterized protein n=1 Tax=Sphaerosporella brunnea TaxID=1250544 RepID=A0A5J5ENG7_9PEZI|nr:hypothetical protein FN846DRAFT_962080 [Sphaerosporella brunnea]